MDFLVSFNGRKKLLFLEIQGEKSFFLLPGEKLEKGIQNVYIMGEDEGLILKATESFMDGVSILLLKFYVPCQEPIFLALY